MVALSAGLDINHMMNPIDMFDLELLLLLNVLEHCVFALENNLTTCHLTSIKLTLCG